MKFKEVSNKWLERTLINKSYKYSSDITNRVRHVNNMIGNLEVDKIKWIDFEDELLKFSKCNPKNNKIPSQKLINNIYNTGDSIMDYAYDLELVSKNPFFNKTTPRGAMKNKRRALDRFEQDLIHSTEHRFKIVGKIMIYTGIRVGEAIALEWDDIDFIKKSVVINKSTQQISANQFVIKEGTKNSKSRLVSIPDVLIEYLMQERAKTKDSKYITTKMNGKIHTLASFYKGWSSYFKTLNYNAYIKNFGGDESYFNPKGVPTVIQHITPHMLRHTYATLLYDAGVDILTAQKLLGHSDPNLTLAIYTHLDEEKKLIGIEKFNEFLKSR